MKKIPIVYLRYAEKDLQFIFDYTEQYNPSAAKKLINSFHSTIRRLSQFPNSGIIPRDSLLQEKGYRIVVLDTYLAFYKVLKNRIEIRRIIHGKQRYTSLL